jgi:2',3'-cyclic-nucleotide 2'-phosphodiesterase/3'-nucleotidase
VPPQIMTWDRRHLKATSQVRDIVAAARAYVPQMREEGAEIIIALSHSGIGAADHTDMMENASVPLAAVDGIDVVLTGHHTASSPVPTMPTRRRRCRSRHDHGQARRHGRLLGQPHGPCRPDAGTRRQHLAHRGTRCPRRGRSTAATRTGRSPRWSRATPVLASVEAEHEATLAYVRRGRADGCAAAFSYFALVADDPSVQIVSNAQTWYIAR